MWEKVGSYQLDRRFYISFRCLAMIRQFWYFCFHLDMDFILSYAFFLKNIYFFPLFFAFYFMLLSVLYCFVSFIYNNMYIIICLYKMRVLYIYCFDNSEMEYNSGTQLYINKNIQMYIFETRATWALHWAVCVTW